MKANIVRLQSTLSFSLVLLGVYVMWGWTLVNGVMVRVIPGSVAMGVNTAGLFIATGLCLWSATGSGMFSIKLRNILPWLLVILPSLILVEHTFDVSLGIDWPSLHALVKDGNSRPGRVAPNTCLAFVFTGIALILFPRASTSKVFRVVLTALTGATLFIGLTALLGYALNLEGMYRLAKYNRMAAATAVAITLIGIGLWLRLQLILPSREMASASPDKRITQVAAIVLTIVTVLTGLIGFSVLKQGFEQSMSDALLRSTKNYAASFSTTINQQVEHANIIASRPALQNHLQRINAEARRLPAQPHIILN